MATHPNELLEEQKAYYRARAGEYDEWFLRQGRYDHGPGHRAQWSAEVDEVRAALERFRPAGRVLELACGTGWWTEQLVRYADSVTAVDASDEVMELNRRRVGDAKVRYERADIFAWEPDGQYDVAFFSFWLSHVPPERFAGFWEMLRGALAPGGRVFLVDSLNAELATAADQRPGAGDEVVIERKLNDGRSFQIVKVFYAPAELAAKLDAMGWDARMHGTESFFLYGHASPR